MKQYSKIDYKINSMILIVSSLVLVLIGSFDLADYGINWIGYIYCFRRCRWLFSMCKF